MGQLQKLESSLRDRGFKIVAVSADSPEYARRSIGKQELTYEVYSDSTMQAARALGIAFRVGEGMRKALLGYGIDIEKASGETHHILPVPAALLVDTDGVVRFVYTNPDHRQRVDPDELMAAVEGMLSQP